MDHAKTVWRLVVNDPYGTLESSQSTFYKVTNSVGKGAVNNTDDVTEVQLALKTGGYFSGAADGCCEGTDEDAVVKALKKFQTHYIPHDKKKNNDPVGLAQVGSRTDQNLKEQAANYTAQEHEVNSSGSSDKPETTLGKHVYYDNNTRTPTGGLRLRGDVGTVMAEKSPPFTMLELTGKLTEHAE